MAMDVFREAIISLQKVKLGNVTQKDCADWGLENVTLRKHQLEGVKWLAERYQSGHGCILGDEMGLGKTLQSITLLSYLKKVMKVDEPFLVVCPLSVVSGWESEFKRGLPCFEVLNYCSGKEERAEIQNKTLPTLKGGASPPFDVLLAHYEVVLKDHSFLQRFNWSCVVIDEGHRLKNPLSMLSKIIKQINSNFILLLTGTPVQNNLNELYSLLSLVSPGTFPTHRQQDFVNYYSLNIESDAVAAELHFILEPFLLRRTKTEVLVDLPTKSEMILYTSLSNVQKNLYKSILTKDLSAFGESGNKTRLLNVMSQLRKCINHPYLFDGIEPEPFELGEHLIEASGKLFIIDKLLQLLKANGHRVLIFSQMTRMLDIMQDYLGYRGYSYDRLDGSIRGEERFLAVQNFTDDTDVFVFLLSTRAGGQGLNLVGADTILFIDSDFNPQNDLQAAARAHRIGQTKPVKIIRLVTRDTAEEIILQRAQAKLSLTEKVIEGGQFSLGASNSVAESTSQLSEILKFGLDKILAENESSLECEDLESIIGCTDANGCWIMDTDVPIEEEEESEQGPDTIYMYEGKDYSNASKDDQKKFDELLAAQLTFVVKGSDERVLRSEQRISLATPISELSTRKRAPLTQEQLEERKRKREENRIKKQKLLEEAERKRQEEKERKKKEWWNKNNYISLNMDLPSSDEEEEEDDDGNDNDIVYLIGDVTHPQNTGNKNAIVVHCTDDSGRWGRGGLFSAISNRSLVPEEHYKLAGKMKDLSLGDAHLISIDDLMSHQEGKDYLALVVAQCRNEGAGKSSGIKLPALTTAFKRISHGALQQDASVHLPRIGHATPNFNWYGTERLIRKYLARRRIPTYVYYFPRHGSSKSKTGIQTTTEAGSDVAAGCSWLPKGVEPLPDIFKNVCVYFHNIDEELKQQLARYIIAYDGDVVDQVTSTISHVISSQSSKTSLTVAPHVAMVTSQWIQDSLLNGKQLDTTKYHITHTHDTVE